MSPPPPSPLPLGPCSVEAAVSSADGAASTGGSRFCALLSGLSYRDQATETTLMTVVPPACLRGTCPHPLTQLVPPCPLLLARCRRYHGLRCDGLCLEAGGGVEELSDLGVGNDPSAGPRQQQPGHLQAGADCGRNGRSNGGGQEPVRLQWLRGLLLQRRRRRW